MIIQNLKLFLFICVLVLSPVLFLAMKYRAKFWKLFGSALFPLILGVLLVYNIVSYPSLNWFAIFPSYQGPLQRLPSNELISLYEHGSAQARVAWIYSLVEIYYPGKILGVPDGLMDSLNLSGELLRTQGRLAGLVAVEVEHNLTENQAEGILAMEKDSIRMDDGNLYHFITEEKDPEATLLLLQRGNELFFIPEDLLPGKEGGL